MSENQSTSFTETTLTTSQPDVQQQIIEEVKSGAQISSATVMTHNTPELNYDNNPNVSVIHSSDGMSESAYIVRDHQELLKMMDGQRAFSGQRTLAEMQLEVAEQAKNNNNQNGEEEVKRVILPPEIFKDFKVVDKENEEEFEYVISCIVVQFLEKFQDTALEFPSIIDGNGRALIHSICNFLGMASHSISSGKNRRIIIYPNHLFLDKQAKEARDREKEREKIYIKLKDTNFPPQIPEPPVSTRDKLIKEVWCEIKGFPKPVYEEVWAGDIAVRLEELKKKVKRFEDNAEKLRAQIEKKKGAQAATANKLSTKTAHQDQKVQAKTTEQQQVTATPKDVANPNFEEIEGASPSGKPGQKKAKVLRYKEKEKKAVTSEGNQKNWQEAVEERKNNNGKPVNSDDSSEYDDEEDEASGKKGKHDSDLDIDSDELEDEYFSMNEEEKKAYREKRERIRKAKVEDFKRRDNFHKQLKEVKLEDFRDKPDEIKTLRCVHVEGNLLVVEWDAPASNNSAIKGYNVYLSKKTIKIGEINSSQDHQKEVKSSSDLDKVATIDIVENIRYHEFRDLEMGTCYYVVVTAVNDFGEGYKSAPFMVRTLEQNLDTQAGTLYVWGSNINSELGLSEDQVLQNISFYQKASMKKIIRQNMFLENSVVQVACGNVSTLFLVIDRENKSQTLVMSGQVTLAKDENSTKIVFTQLETETQVETIPSIPFGLDFNIPVSKIICGDLFAGLLTAQGEVYTWGWNVFGQLGLKDTSVGVTLNPTKVDFGNAREKIIDISCGFNSCIALTDTQQVYVWGKRMGIYPSIDFNLHAIETRSHIFVSEINQDTPRLLKQNLIFYKIAKIISGQSNSGLITDKGEFLVQGMNDYAQLGIGGDQEHLSRALIFFGDFMKKDFFSQNNLIVVDVSFGSYHTLVLCEDKQSKKRRVFGCGSTEKGQLCTVSSLKHYSYTELTHHFPEEISQISAGSMHSLFLTKDGRVFGSGNNSKGQLGFKSDSSNKLVGKPAEIKIAHAAQISEKFKTEVISVRGGSLYSMALCRTAPINKK